MFVCEGCYSFGEIEVNCFLFYFLYLFYIYFSGAFISFNITYKYIEFKQFANLKISHRVHFLSIKFGKCVAKIVAGNKTIFSNTSIRHLHTFAPKRLGKQNELMN